MGIVTGTGGRASPEHSICRVADLVRPSPIPASQGAWRLLWPLLANLTRLAIAADGGWFALQWGGDRRGHGTDLVG